MGTQLMLWQNLPEHRLAKAVIDGRLDPVALTEDAVFDAAMQQALGTPRRQAAAALQKADATLRFAHGEITAKDDIMLFGLNPESLNQMDENQLRMYQTRAAEGLSTQALSPVERATYQEFNIAVTKALDNLESSRAALAKAVQGDVKEAPPPQKSKGKMANQQGDTAYQYEKKNGGKSPANTPTTKKGPKGAAAPGAADGANGQDPQLAPAAQVDPKIFAGKLGVDVKLIKNLAQQNSRDGFIAYFGRFTRLSKNLNLTSAYLSSLYDTLTAPPAPPPNKKSPLTPAAAPAPQAAPPEAAAKAILHFVGGSSDPKQQHLVDLLKSAQVSSETQMQRVLAQHFALGPDDAAQLQRTLLRRWEGDAVVELSVAS